jgi:thiol-disulfide isomerase/thioredoxin
VVALTSLLLLAGCSGLQGTGNKGYISGDGSIVQYHPGDRGDAIDLSGDSVTGDPVDVTGLRGKVVVVNVWWSGCAPCRSEMPMLVDAEAELRNEADFVGIDIRDNSAAPARAFMAKYGATYPSIYDPNGKALLSFSGQVSPQTVPATMVLDKQGRVAATIRGPVPSKLTLTELVREVAAEDG